MRLKEAVVIWPSSLKKHFYRVCLVHTNYIICPPSSVLWLVAPGSATYTSDFLNSMTVSKNHIKERPEQINFSYIPVNVDLISRFILVRNTEWSVLTERENYVLIYSVHSLIMGMLLYVDEGFSINHHFQFTHLSWASVICNGLSQSPRQDFLPQLLALPGVVRVCLESIPTLYMYKRHWSSFHVP